MDEIKPNNKPNLTGILLMVLVVGGVCVIFLGLVFYVLYGQQSKPTINPKTEVTEDNNGSATENPETKEPESLETKQNREGLVNNGRIVLVEGDILTIKDENLGKISEAKMTGQTKYYVWDKDSFDFRDGQKSEVRLGDKILASYQDEGNSNELIIVWVSPPFVVNGLIEKIDGDNIFINNVDEGKKYTAMKSGQTRVKKITDSGQKVDAFPAELAVGDKMVAYSDYGIDYNKSSFETVYIEIVSKNTIPVKSADDGAQPVTSTTSDDQPINTTPPPVGINPSGTLPGVEIGQ